MMERAGGELARRAAVRGHHEHVREAELEIAGAVHAIDHLVDHARRRRPLRALGRPGHLRQGPRLLGHAQSSQVVVTKTVRDLVTGTDLRFLALGETSLRGVPGQWELYEARTSEG